MWSSISGKHDDRSLISRKEQTDAEEAAQRVPVLQHDDLLGQDVSDADSDDLTSLCRICGSDEMPDLLISPCSCAGSQSTVHTTCLQRWIMVRSGVRQADNGHQVRSDPLMCEVCRVRYRIKLARQFVFDWSRCCLPNSLGHTCELLVLALLGLSSLVLMGSEFSNGDPLPEHAEFGSSGADKVVLPLFCLLALTVYFVAAKKVWERLRIANSVVIVTPR